jgi:hypothetical protein
MRAIRLFVLLIAVGACSGGPDAGKHARALQRAGDELAGQTYRAAHGSRKCQVDCAGHEAGYRWAQERRYSDASLCISRSQSFNEGCEAYAEDLAQRVAQEEASQP